MFQRFDNQLFLLCCAVSQVAKLYKDVGTVPSIYSEKMFTFLLPLVGRFGAWVWAKPFAVGDSLTGDPSLTTSKSLIHRYEVR